MANRKSLLRSLWLKYICEVRRASLSSCNPYFPVGYKEGNAFTSKYLSLLLPLAVEGAYLEVLFPLGLIYALLAIWALLLHLRL